MLHQVVTIEDGMDRAHRRQMRPSELLPQLLKALAKELRTTRLLRAKKAGKNRIVASDD
jgi:hypothetical protein